MPVPIFVCEVACASGFAGAREVCYPMLEIFLLQKMMIQTVALEQHV
jgi:hypothetical protein